MSSSDFFILACSPRENGNSDAAANYFCEAVTAPSAFCKQTEGLSGRLQQRASPFYLRSLGIKPCTGCDSCLYYTQKNQADVLSLAENLVRYRESSAGEKEAQSLRELQNNPLLSNAFGCPLSKTDDCLVILKKFLFSPAVCLVSPIYFYHLPAQFKALLDRTQPLWSVNNILRRPLLPPRPAFCILLGARPKGEKLFEGSLLSLKYALAQFNIVLQEPLLLYGLDARSDLANSTEARQLISDYAGKAHKILEMHAY